MNKLQRIIDVTIEARENGFYALAHTLNVSAEAKNMEALTKNLLEALSKYYEDKGFWVDYDNLRLRLDIPQFFQHYRVLNAKFLAKRIGMNPTLLSQYVRGFKEPSPKQMNRIIKGINEIGKELAGLEWR